MTGCGNGVHKDICIHSYSVVVGFPCALGKKFTLGPNAYLMIDILGARG